MLMGITSSSAEAVPGRQAGVCLLPASLCHVQSLAAAASALQERRWFPDQHLMGWVFWFGLFYLFIFLLSPIIIIHIDYTYR